MAAGLHIGSHSGRCWSHLPCAHPAVPCGSGGWLGGQAVQPRGLSDHQVLFAAMLGLTVLAGRPWVEGRLVSRSSCCAPLLCNDRGKQIASQGSLWPELHEGDGADFLVQGQPGWISFPSPAVWGMMPVCDVLTAGDPKRCPSSEPGKENICDLQGISSLVAPCAAEATVPFPVCGWPRAQGGERGGRWLLVGGSLL